MKKTLLIVFILYNFWGFGQKFRSFQTTKFDSTITEGYYFIVLKDSLVILDKNLDLLYVKTFKQVYNFDLIENGNMFFYSSPFFYEMDSTFKTLDSIACKNGVETDPHDIIFLPKGNVILMGTEKVKFDISKFPEWKSRMQDTSGTSSTVIQEMDTNKNVIFEWHAKDHFELNDADLFFDSLGGQWLHSNAIELDTDGNILLSSRNLNEITKINRKDGSIMWRLGGKRNEFKFVDCPVPFYGQHNIRRLENGHLTLFDNGMYIESHRPRALEFELDEKNKVAYLKWSYVYNKDITSVGRGNVERMKNGNTLICFGNQISNDLCFIVVNASGAVLFQVNSKPAINPYKVIYHPTLPFKLHRPEIKCADLDGAKYLDAGAGYKSYKWSTGDSTRTIAIKQAGSYSVFVPYGEGGYISSEKIIINDAALPCKTKNNYKKNKK